MATIRAYTTIEQSRKLADILPLESADMHYGEYCAGGENFPIPNCDDDYNGHCCWSLTALLGVLPYGYSSIITKSFNGKDYYCKIDGKPFETEADNPIDACYEMIIRLNELKML